MGAKGQPHWGVGILGILVSFPLWFFIQLPLGTLGALLVLLGPIVAGALIAYARARARRRLWAVLAAEAAAATLGAIAFGNQGSPDTSFIGGAFLLGAAATLGFTAAYHFAKRREAPLEPIPDPSSG